jgi:hypothetical protein
MARPLAACLALALAAPAAQDLGAPGAKPAERPYKLNARIAEELCLTGLDEQPRALFAEHPERALVLVFWSYRDPVSRFYAPRLAELARAHEGRVAILLVDSNSDELLGGSDPLAKLRAVVAEEKVTLPVLLDRGNAVADALGATANGQAFVIDANRTLRYHGGIDDDPDGARRAQGIPLRTWLANALEAVLAGRAPAENWTRPSGRPIKRSPARQAPGPEKAGPRRGS